MKPAELYELIPWSKQEVDNLDCATLLRSRIIDRARFKLGGSHTVVTYPPLDALEFMDSSRILPALSPVDELNLYAHIAFCEYLCPFCHYETTFSRIGTLGDQVRAYLDALSVEIGLWKERLSGSFVSSLYIGGGTPTALPEEALLSLFAEFATLPRNPTFGASVETSPLTTAAEGGRQKLASLVRAGVNRLSIGVQSFDSRLLRRSRGHDRQIVFEALDIVLGLGVEVNIDMIQDLPDQTDESIIDDIIQISRFRPSQVTWYIMRLRPEAAWYGRLSRGALNVSDSINSIRRRLLIRKAMKLIGYVPKSGGRFFLEETLSDRFKEVRSCADSSLLGIGVGAYSHGWGYFFRNITSRGGNDGIKSYIECLRRGNLAVESGLHLDEIELLASAIVKGIRTGLSIPTAKPETHLYLLEVNKKLADLQEAGLVSIDNQGVYHLTELGSLLEEEVCSLFYSGDVQERLSRKDALWINNVQEAKQVARK